MDNTDLENGTGNRGWICLHRKLLDNPIMTSVNHTAVWVKLLLMASHKESTFYHYGTKVTLQAGQLLTGTKKLSEVTGVASTTLRRILQNLESGNQITQQTTNKYRIITIVNWHKYQDKSESGNQVANKWQSGGNQVATFNNDNNDNNDNKEGGAHKKKETASPGREKDSSIEPPSSRFKRPSVEEVKVYIESKGYSVDAQRFVDYNQSRGWVIGKSPMKDWKACVRTWASKDNQNRKRTNNADFGNQKSSVGITVKTGV